MFLKMRRKLPTAAFIQRLNGKDGGFAVTGEADVHCRAGNDRVKARGNNYPVIEIVGEDLVLIARDYYEVFSKEQTVPIQEKRPYRRSMHRYLQNDKKNLQLT